MNDDQFLRNKVPMTKAEVRSVSIERLALGHKKSMLDIGSGTGSVSIQASLEYPNLKVTAVEKNPDGIAIMRENLKKFNIKNIELMSGTAPTDLPDQNFDSIFVGGSGGELGEIIEYSFEHLNKNGCLVLNFILLENAIEATQLLEKSVFSDLQVSRIEVSHIKKLGKGHFFVPQNPTIIISARKDGE
ncbi:decarboxylating cobalt-precorrin-6B (C(15))-methyltransferase [Pediococcus claussenii]|uniref:Precorrin-6Y C5,15-methyltransferase (Decarboxylating), CbiT subunit n=1 Tax=Pediococcus claussenii (strain ATCC BAA-344 / DSM 14800 / JCM 18046 / KCTC 3811 / LMG 21948 / P06) TaxID=701521 RepID=G8PEL3_PEDCP|nr:decarboxylating cobalt-precorrin-6B (C(15))-methyltransferase [Pediococcus claussenii]AEV95622.1 precorrin-6Y C5,15-methyltransferase (decarboxylating), CbiT subunit [Pediococcus claussenii ATCC BAA-344]ANZ69142.1 cobalt-precorrin-6Y C(15)-methyltransferase [Pediococcus claussenii]ANZ70959.1 cobalt-precorrin-6Y C(15)-methyltransferase [Pediococcus claussenii]KRN20145.1 cbiT protein [Pediococcus claussenii]